MFIYKLTPSRFINPPCGSTESSKPIASTERIRVVIYICMGCAGTIKWIIKCTSRIERTTPPLLSKY
jgi:hypothetical protein